MAHVRVKTTKIQF